MLELERLVGDVEWAKAHRLPPRELVPMLRRLVAVAPAGSPEGRTARRDLAELLVTTRPWLAARLATEVLKGGADDRAYGVLGLAHTVLGNYRCAARAYRAALAIAPGTAEYEHNLGHLLDVAFDRPERALVHLRRAFAAFPGETEVASSLAHALLRAGHEQEARTVLESAFDGDLERVRATLARWV
ncbi:MAG TPA: tetratricopeptide repeat protein [Polyangiaceae bacterium]|nr:tetratricopeptide repeat protein [Polyangiaceae bacterium]